jgi:hypothetical protein
MTRLALILIAATACGVSSEDSGPRYESNQDGVSFAKLDGWSIGRQRDTLVLTRAGEPGTIAVRTIRRDRDGASQVRDERTIFPAVERVLRALPRARVSGPTEVDHPLYRVQQYQIEFTPPGRRHRVYQRLHASMVTDSLVIHVFLTAQSGQLDRDRRAFETVLRSIREEDQS